ncbi:MAG: hypothetical protein R3321_04150 [Nitrososphaeraceae archaeon]|nr:hypothetical protein [Nitrososphaeraceae archaeon]
MTIREKQINDVDSLIKSADIRFSWLLNREQIVVQCCNKHIIDFLDERINDCKKTIDYHRKNPREVRSWEKIIAENELIIENFEDLKGEILK